MKLGVTELFQLCHGAAGIDVRGSADGKSNQHLVCMETGVLALHVVYLQGLDRNDDIGRDELDLVIDLGEGLQGIEKCRRGGTQKNGGSAGDDPSVGKLNGNGGLSGAVCHSQCRREYFVLSITASRKNCKKTADLQEVSDVFSS